MTVHFNKHRQRWVYDFVKAGKRYQGNCLDAAGQPVTSKSSAKQAEGVEKRRIEMEPKVAKPGEMTVAMAIAALIPIWKLQANWFARRIQLRDIEAFFGGNTAIADIDQARADDYKIHLRTARMMAWKGGPLRDPAAESNASFWVQTDKVRSVATINLYLGTLRQIFERAASHRDPQTGMPAFTNLPQIKDLRRPKRKGRPMPKQISAEIMSIMPPHVVDAMMLTSFFGFRKGEAFGLLRTNIDWDNGGIRLLAEDVKDDEDVFLPGDQYAMGYLWCLDIESQQRKSKHLVTWFDKKVGCWMPIKKPRAAWNRARAFMREKYGRTWRWHDLRGAFISNVALESGGVVAQTLARHSDFSTTQLYIEVADEMRRLAAERISDNARAIAENESPLQDSLTQGFAPKPGARTDRKLRLVSKG